MKKKTTMSVIIAIFLFGLSSGTFAVEGDLDLSNKEIIEKLVKLEEGQNGLNKRIDDINRRIDHLRGEFKGDINDLRGLIYVVLAGIIALIGFVIWDRRSALSPVIRKTKELEERDDLTVRALKEDAMKEPKMAEVPKSLGLL
jgi:tetrahydromethanopterin S-methyltransferase subunit G